MIAKIFLSVDKYLKYFETPRVDHKQDFVLEGQQLIYTLLKLSGGIQLVQKKVSKNLMKTQVDKNKNANSKNYLNPLRQF